MFEAVANYRDRNIDSNGKVSFEGSNTDEEVNAKNLVGILEQMKLIERLLVLLFYSPIEGVTQPPVEGKLG